MFDCIGYWHIYTTGGRLTELGADCCWMSPNPLVNTGQSVHTSHTWPISQPPAALLMPRCAGGSVASSIHCKTWTLKCFFNGVNAETRLFNVYFTVSGTSRGHRGSCREWQRVGDWDLATTLSRLLRRLFVLAGVYAFLAYMPSK